MPRSPRPSTRSVADAFALYLKTKNFHWHLSGTWFRDLHLLFDEHAEAIFSSIDVLAERVRKIGGTTIRSVSHMSELQTIADDNDDYVSADEMVLQLCRRQPQHGRVATKGARGVR